MVRNNMVSMREIVATDFVFPGQQQLYRGKVRDVYDLGQTMLMVATDRYSAFDRNLAVIPGKGEVTTATSRWWFDQMAPVTPNHIIGYPDPNVTWCKKYPVVPLEMVVRGHITGVTTTSLWHHYSQGRRDFGSFVLPDGLVKNQRLPEPVLTPTTKFEAHDRFLTPQEAIAEKLVDAPTWERLAGIALQLFRTGQRLADDKGLVLVDTKYEFGIDEDGNPVLIDELHSQDSSRYWLAEQYQAQLAKGEEPDYHDKEFLRLWFKQRFDPYSNQLAPNAPPAVLSEMLRRYVVVQERLTGQPFVFSQAVNPLERIDCNVRKALSGEVYET